jgi:glycosyltransferase involved in cell wall biosynthesis
MSPSRTRLAIVGTVGLPPRYGGFETLAARLVEAAAARGAADRITVWCSGPQSGDDRPTHWMGAHLRYLPLRGNGVHSIAYDALSLRQAARSGHDVALLLGVSGASALPLIRATSAMRIISHIDGIEWRRPKWGPVARAVLRRSEAMAVRWSDHVIADHPDITTHVRQSYGRAPVEIAYGHETPAPSPPAAIADLGLPDRYALAIARAEPDNNLALLLEAFAEGQTLPLVILSNWQTNAYGRGLLARFGRHPALRLLDAEYDPGRLGAIREGATVYLHGHEAGGTNPSLVEMMGHGRPIAAYDCGFNRSVTEGKAAYFDSVETLRAVLPVIAEGPEAAASGTALQEIARRRYRWSEVTDAYFDLLGF